MSIFMRPLALTDDGRKHEPMAPGRLVDPETLPLSKDRANLLALEEDGYLLKADALLSQSEQVLSVTDNKLRTTLSLKLNAATNILELYGANDTLIAEVKLPVVPGLPVVAEILKDFTPPAMDYGEQPEGAYMHLQFQMSDGVVKDIYYNVSDLVDIYKGGDGITITDNVVIFTPEAGRGLGVGREGAYVKPVELLAAGEKIISAVNEKFQTTLALEVDAKANAIRLLGVAGAVVSEAELPPYSGAPKVVEVVSNFTPPGLSRGVYLHMQFVRADGEVEDLYYSLEPVVDIYEAGNGIAIDGHVVSVKPEQGKGVAVTANGVAVAATELLHEGEKILGVADNAFYTQFSLVLDEETNELICYGKDKQEVSRVKLPFGKGGGAPTVFEFLTDFTPPPPHGADAVQLPRSNYLHLHYDMGGGEEEDIYLEVPFLARWTRRVDGPLPEGEELEKLLADMPVDGLVYYTEGGINPVFLTPDEAVERFVSLTLDQGIGGKKVFDECPEAPTPPDGDESNKLATTQFVWDAITGKHSTDFTIMRLNTDQTVESVKTFTKSPIVPTPAAGDSSGKAASTEFVTSAIAKSQADDATVVRLTGAQTVTGVKTFSDSPVVPTATAGDSSTKAASTAFVTSAITEAHKNDNTIVRTTGNQTIAGVKTFSASPVVPTATAGDSSTKAASTAFVTDAVNNPTIVRTVGDQDIGGEKTFSVLPKVPTAPAGDNTAVVANTAFVTGAIAAAHAAAPTLVRTAGDQTIDGIKTFLQSPVVPTAAKADNSTKAASTAYVQSVFGDAVKTSGNQTIAGTKTFSASPVAPTPAVTDNSTKVATTAFVQTLCSNQLKVVVGPQPEDPSALIANMPVGTVIQFTE